MFGIDYGWSSWTDLDEARSLAVDLELVPGVSLLEVGSGAGWPGLFLASSSGCTVTLTDLPLTVELTTDVTAERRDRVERYLLHLELLGDRLEDVHGTDGIADLRRSRLAYRSAVDAGLLRRRVHFAVPA